MQKSVGVALAKFAEACEFFRADAAAVRFYPRHVAVFYALFVYPKRHANFLKTFKIKLAAFIFLPFLPKKFRVFDAYFRRNNIGVHRLPFYKIWARFYNKFT